MRHSVSNVSRQVTVVASQWSNNSAVVHNCVAMSKRTTFNLSTAVKGMLDKSSPLNNLLYPFTFCHSTNGITGVCIVQATDCAIILLPNETDTTNNTVMCLFGRIQQVVKDKLIRSHWESVLLCYQGLICNSDYCWTIECGNTVSRSVALTLGGVSGSVWTRTMLCTTLSRDGHTRLCKAFY